MPEQIPLRLVTPFCPQQLQLVPGFDTFGGDHDAETLGQTGHRSHDRNRAGTSVRSLTKERSILILSKEKWWSELKLE